MSCSHTFVLFKVYAVVDVREKAITQANAENSHSGPMQPIRHGATATTKQQTAWRHSAAAWQHGALSLFFRTHFHHIGSATLYLAIPCETRLCAGKTQNRAERIAQRNRVMPGRTIRVNEVTNHNDRAA